MSIASRLAGVPGGAFLRSVGVLVSGTIFAHGVTALAMPVATRLYSPADFNVLAAFVGLMSIVGGVACLRLDAAVPLPEEHVAGANLLVTALVCCAAVSLVVASVVLTAPLWVARQLHQPAVQGSLWLLPIGVFMVGAYSVWQSWFVRQKDFASIARTRLGQSSLGASLQLGLGWLGIAPLGLIAGNIVTTSGGGLGLALRALRGPVPVLSVVSIGRMREQLRVYRRFPTYSTVEALCNSAGIQVPVILISTQSVAAEAGFLMLAMFVIQAPMGLIGTSVSQVYVSRAPQEHRCGRLAAFTTEVYGGLLKAGVGPLVFAGIAAPSAVAIVFGQEWQRAGVLVAWMTPWFVVQFVVVPVSIAMHVTNHLRSAFALQVVGMILRVLAVVVAADEAPRIMAEAYALSGFVFYLIYLVVVLWVVGANAGDVGRRTLRALPMIAGWAICGALCSIAIDAVAKLVVR